MHACGHDCHVAIMMAVAEILAAHRGELRGTVTLIFQPAEENLPNGEIGGARRMLTEGAFNDPKPDAMFGLHVLSILPAGVLGYRAGVTLASTDEFRITVTGRQTHAAFPWSGVDPIAVGAQIVSAPQTIQSRQVNVAEPSVLSVATFHGGNREHHSQPGGNGRHAADHERGSATVYAATGAGIGRVRSTWHGR